MKRLLTSLILSLSLVSLYAQQFKTPQDYTSHGLTLQDSSHHQKAIIYLDSAYQLYVDKQYYSSATKIAFALDSSFQSLKFSSDSLLHYYEALIDSITPLKKYDNNATITSLLEQTTLIYENEGAIFKAAKIRELLEPRYQKLSNKKASFLSKNELALANLNFFEGNFNQVNHYAELVISSEQASSQDKLEAKVLKIENAIKLAKFSQAKHEIKLLEQQMFPVSEKKAANTYTNILPILIEYEKGNYKRGFVLQEKHFKSYQPDTSASHLTILVLETLAAGYIENGLYDKAYDYINAALQLNKKVYPSFHPSTYGLYDKLAYVYYLRSDYGYAKEIAVKQFNIRYALLSNKHPDLAFPYYLRTLISIEQEEYTKGLPLIDSALQIYQNFYSQEHLKIANCFNLKGVCLLEQGKITQAESFLQKAKQQYQNLIPNVNHVYFAKIYNDLGLLYQRDKKNDKAIDNYIKSLKIYKKLLGNVHPYLGYGYYNVGTLYENKGDLASAIQSYQLSIVANHTSFTDTTYQGIPPLKSVLSDIIMLNTLVKKAAALDAFASLFSQPIETLEVELNTYLIICDLIDKLRISYVSEESKLYLSEKTSFVYEKGILVSLRLYQQTKKESYKESAFLFSEKSKNGILISAINEVKAKKVGGVPDSLIAYEETLIATINQLETSLFNEYNKGTYARQKVIDELTQNLFEQKQAYQQFVDLLESTYSKYYALKYKPIHTTIQEARSLLVQQQTSSKRINKKDNYTLIEYFEGIDSLYIFLVDQTQFKIVTKPKDKKYRKAILGLKNAIKFNLPHVFSKKSNLVYQYVFEPIAEDISTKHLLIIPDGALLFVPFEVLCSNLSNKKLEKFQYSQLDYLIKKHKIHYNYSVGLFREIEKEHVEIDQQRLLAFAPIFDGKQEEQVLAYGIDSSLTNQLHASSINAKDGNLEPLEGSYIESQNLISTAKGKKQDYLILLQDMATESTFKQLINQNFNVIHLATHSEVNSSNISQSKIHLLPDNQEDGILTIKEIFAMRFQADLVSLSSCQTGLGSYVKGEGIMSFSRSFFYAGAQSLLVSLWKVPDVSTTQLISTFYHKYYQTKHDKVSALRKAKLKLAKHKKFAAPINWASFIYVGGM